MEDSRTVEAIPKSRDKPVRAFYLSSLFVLFIAFTHTVYQTTKWEPCVSGNTRVCLPVSLALLNDLSPILNMDVYLNVLNDADRSQLRVL